MSSDSEDDIIETIDLDGLDLDGFPSALRSTDSDDLAASLEPIVLSTSISTTYAQELHELLQSPAVAPYRILIEFDIQPAATDGGVSGFAGVLKFTCKTTAKEIKRIESEGCYPNKRRAKEEIAREGVEWVKSKPKEIEECPTRVVDLASGMAGEGLDEKENWVGELHGYCQLRGGTLPVYTYYTSPTYLNKFSCDIRGIGGMEDRVFGEKTAYYKSKKAAKIQAAKAAMLWIRANPPPPLPARSGAPGTNVSKKKKIRVAAAGDTITVPAKAGPVEKVSIIMPRLAYSMPDYRLTQDPRAPSIYDVYALVIRADGSKVKVGPRLGMRGKKVAKEAIAKGVLKWVKDEAEKKGVIIQEEL